MPQLILKQILGENIAVNSPIEIRVTDKLFRSSESYVVPNTMIKKQIRFCNSNWFKLRAVGSFFMLGRQKNLKLQLNLKYTVTLQLILKQILGENIAVNKSPIERLELQINRFDQVSHM